MKHNELVKALRCCANLKTDCTVCPWDKYNYAMCAESLYTTAAVAIEALQAANEELSRELLEERADRPHWISAELPPKEYGRYVVCRKDVEKFHWGIADWDEDWCTEEPNWYVYDGNRAIIIAPDYWMPIEPPQEVQE